MAAKCRECGISVGCACQLKDGLCITCRGKKKKRKNETYRIII